ncbi:TPA: hypothetical protein L3390_003626 [Escherichia coli]|nr:hypothetical protein [Escherichia coli]HBN7149148.1 hypothetical protein [Escherichia coli]
MTLWTQTTHYSLDSGFALVAVGSEGQVWMLQPQVRLFPSSGGYSPGVGTKRFVQLVYRIGDAANLLI